MGEAPEAAAPGAERPAARPGSAADRAPADGTSDGTSDGAAARRTRPRPGGDHALARWQVSFDTGEQFEVRGLTLVGRRPEARPESPSSGW